MLEKEQNVKGAKARTWWNELPLEQQKKILSSAWCPSCYGHVDMDFRDVKLNEKGLMIEGICTQCQSKLTVFGQE
ncbi:hypothetical protein [Lactococcus lactis]|uniref:Uncharacterized protein n=2 Tax=Lactococcus lactis TaxID=1358 RepID=A0A0V8ELY2_LACLL|nr:hypothetical protein [Lactococcus lactis]MDN6242367.1 hypothetical protein [Tetragenococcus koreensis]KST89233.1 hypothetical protein ATCC19435_0255 [Lactococcus lactis subsp. lactis]KSU26559.1 hypothetical protein N42_1497 [Lactococcus lactis subsp. lactis]MBU3886367.1 hypothetical protein [Lactococcus lactis]MCT3119459.1 hypothetical protein [Lactococcus lactis]